MDGSEEPENKDEMVSPAPSVASRKRLPFEEWVKAMNAKEADYESRFRAAGIPYPGDDYPKLPEHDESKPTSGEEMLKAMDAVAAWRARGEELLQQLEAFESQNKLQFSGRRQAGKPEDAKGKPPTKGTGR